MLLTNFSRYKEYKKQKEQYEQEKEHVNKKKLNNPNYKIVYSNNYFTD